MSSRPFAISIAEIPDNLLHTYWSVRFPLPASLPGLQYFQMRSAPDFFSVCQALMQVLPQLLCHILLCSFIFDSVHLFLPPSESACFSRPFPILSTKKAGKKYFLFKSVFCLPLSFYLKDYFFGTILIVLQSVVRIRSILPESFCMPLRLLCCMVSLLPSTHFIKIIRSTSFMHFAHSYLTNSSINYAISTTGYVL